MNALSCTTSAGNETNAPSGAGRGPPATKWAASDLARIRGTMDDRAKPNDALAEVGGVNVHAGAAVPSRDR